jgi:hypothetical protein
MGEKLSKAEDDAVCIHIPKALYDRVETYCHSNGIAPRDFIFDAVSEKLASMYRERRRKQRL